MTEKQFRIRFAHLIKKYGEPILNNPRIDGKRIMYGANFPIIERTRNNPYSYEVIISINHDCHWVDEYYYRFLGHTRHSGSSSWCYQVVTNYKTNEKFGEYYYLNRNYHRSNGPAIVSYKDGKVERGRCGYFWRGIEMTYKAICKPKTQNLWDIFSIQNIEGRRIAIERLGWMEYLKLAGPSVLDQSDDEISGTKQTLFSHGCGTVEEAFIANGNFLVCSCPSTSRIYAIEVPLSIKTCKKAQSWLMGERLHKFEMIGAS